MSGKLPSFLLQRKQQKSLMLVASLAPPDVAPRAVLLGTKHRQGPLSRTRRATDLKGAEAMTSVSQRREIKAFVHSFIHSFIQYAAVEYLICASQGLDIKIRLRNPLKEKQAFYKNTGCVDTGLFCLFKAEKHCRVLTVFQGAKQLPPRTPRALGRDRSSSPQPGPARPSPQGPGAASCTG